MAADSRKNVLSMLEDVTRKGKLSHIVAADIDEDSRAFTLRLFNGTLERAIFLDHIINSHCSNPSKVKPVIRNILRMSVYQMLFMDSVPDRAAVNEAVKLAVSRGLTQLKGFVNGVLRSIQREIEAEGGAASYVSKAEKEIPKNIKYSVPEWMYSLIVNEYGKEKGEAFLEAALKPEKPLCFRTVEIREEKEQILEELRRDGAEISGEEVLRLKLPSGKSLTDLSSYKNGHIFVQDAGSQLAAREAAEALKEALKESKELNPLIIDVCAAPGGKATFAAEQFPGARVIARDISETKTELIEENISRLGLSNMITEVKDATVSDPENKGRANLVIADLPCSGLGTIGGKPDIRLRVKPEDIQSLAKLQRTILSSVCEMVKEGGVLAFSTCTVTPQENRENAVWFEEKYPFIREKEIQLLPSDGTDGFYICIFKRKDDR